jgi:hypothetical protein
MAPVFPEMSRNSIGSRQNGQVGSPDWIGLSAAPRIPHGCDMVDIDAETKRRSFHKGVLT